MIKKKKLNKEEFMKEKHKKDSPYFKSVKDSEGEEGEHKVEGRQEQRGGRGKRGGRGRGRGRGRDRGGSGRGRGGNRIGSRGRENEIWDEKNTDKKTDKKTEGGEGTSSGGDWSGNVQKSTGGGGGGSGSGNYGGGQNRRNPKNTKKNFRGYDSLEKPEDKRQGRTHHNQYRKKEHEGGNEENEENPENPPKEEDVDNEKEEVNVEEQSESSEYYPEGVLTENKTENKLVDVPLNQNPNNKTKGFNSYMKSLENQKGEVEKLLETVGIVSKVEVVTTNIEVVSMNKRERPPELEEINDDFFFGNKNVSETKKKKTKQQQGPKNIPVSEVLHVKSKRHRGFNTVPDDGPKERRNFNKTDTKEQPKDTKGTDTKEQSKENTQSEWDQPLEGKEIKGTETKEQPKENKGWDQSRENKGWDQSRENKGWDQQTEKGTEEPRSKEYHGQKDKSWNDRSNSRKQPPGGRGRGGGGPSRRSRFDIESTQQFPPLSENIVPQTPEKWGPSGKS